MMFPFLLLTFWSAKYFTLLIMSALGITKICLLIGCFSVPLMAGGFDLRSLPLDFEHKNRAVANVSSSGYYQMSIPLRPVVVDDYRIPVNLEFSTNPKERSMLGLFWSLPLLESKIYHVNRNTVVFVGINKEKIGFDLSKLKSTKGVFEVGSWRYEDLGNSKELVSYGGSPAMEFNFVDGVLRRLDISATSDSGSASLLFKSLANSFSIVDRRSARELLVLDHSGHRGGSVLTMNHRDESYNYEIEKQELRIQNFSESVIQKFHGDDVGFDCHYSESTDLNNYRERVNRVGARFGLKFRKMGEVLKMDIDSSNEVLDADVVWEVASGWPIGSNGGILYVTSTLHHFSNKFKCLRAGMAAKSGWEYFDYDESTGSKDYYNSDEYSVRELKILTPGATYMKSRKIVSRLANGSLSEEKISYDRYGNKK